MSNTQILLPTEEQVQDLTLTELKRLNADADELRWVIEREFERRNNLEKPYVAAISSYSGGGKMQFKTEEQARKKLKEYAGKTYFKNGLSYGVYLYRHNPDGTKTLLESKPMGTKDFRPHGFPEHKVEQNTTNATICIK